MQEVEVICMCVPVQLTVFIKRTGLTRPVHVLCSHGFKVV
jgi:hypothetical protein